MGETYGVSLNSILLPSRVGDLRGKGKENTVTARDSKIVGDYKETLSSKYNWREKRGHTEPMSVHTIPTHVWSNHTKSKHVGDWIKCLIPNEEAIFY